MPQESIPELHAQRTAQYREKLDNFDQVEEVLDNWNRGLLVRNAAPATIEGGALTDFINMLPSRPLSRRVVDYALQVDSLCPR